MATPLEYNATIIERIDHTPLLATFVTQYNDEAELPATFSPGQYVAIGLNNETRPELGSVRRAMSIASAPRQGNRFEFYVRFVERPTSTNPLTHLLWRAKPGDGIFVAKKPVGKFTLGHTVGEAYSKAIVLVAAGTGIAPFVSMIRERRLADPAASMRDVVLLHGVSRPEDLGYREELELDVRERGLHYFPTISRPNDAPTWKGDKGRVEDFFLPDRRESVEQRIEARSPLSPQNAGILVCGLQGTIGKTIERMADRRFVPHDRKIRKALSIEPSVPASIWWEQYDSDPVVDLDDPAVVIDLQRKLSEPPASR